MLLRSSMPEGSIKSFSFRHYIMVASTIMLSLPGFVLLGCASKGDSSKTVIFWKDEGVNGIVKKVSSDKLIQTIRVLEGYRTRHTHEKQIEVAQYLFNRLKEQDLDVRYQDYTWKSKIYKNVEVVMRGRESPNRYFVVGAHYDSESETPDDLAPGADDNGSGVAALLELVRILKDYELRNTVRIVFFSNEEVGQRGSSSYVNYLKSLREEMLGAIIVDMIGYAPENKDLDIVTLSRYRWLAQATKQVGEMYGLVPMKLRVGKHCF